MKALAIIVVSTFCVLSCIAKDVEWTHTAKEGEDATSTHYYFYESNGGSIQRIRSVWNGGAGNAPTVTEYLLGSDRITVRESVGKREFESILTAGKEAELDLKEEYSFTVRDYSDRPVSPEKRLTERQLIALKNIIDLLAMDRKPCATKVEPNGGVNPAKAGDSP